MRQRLREGVVRFGLLGVLLGVLSGCPVTQSQNTPVKPRYLIERETDRRYWLYVPSYYDPNRTFPLVITLHGTFGWDGQRPQIKEWRALAEKRGLIVAAPKLRSVQGITPVVRKMWFADLQADEAAILAIMEEISRNYSIDERAVLLTGFSAGGYPMYYVGLRNPDRFSMLIARACNSSVDLFEHIELTDDARKLPIVIFWGKDDLGKIKNQSWAAFRYLREHGFRKTEREKIKGGHLRRPDVAYRFWRDVLPDQHKM